MYFYVNIYKQSAAWLGTHYQRVLIPIQYTVLGDAVITRPVFSQPPTIDTYGPFYKHGLTLIPAWIGNHMHYKVWDEITYPFLNFNGATVEV